MPAAAELKLISPLCFQILQGHKNGSKTRTDRAGPAVAPVEVHQVGVDRLTVAEAMGGSLLQRDLDQNLFEQQLGCALLGTATAIVAEYRLLC